MFIGLHFPILTAISIPSAVCTEVIGDYTDKASQLDTFLTGGTMGRLVDLSGGPSSFKHTILLCDA